VIDSVYLDPTLPSTAVDLKAVVKKLASAPDAATFRYEWVVNEKPLKNAQGEVLLRSQFRKGDRIFVRAISLIGGSEGAPYPSSVVSVVNAAPDITLADDIVVKNDLTELTVKGTDSDGDPLTYGLEPPVPKGMSIDQTTGKITWKLDPASQGVVKFKATVKDSDGAKTTKTFEVNVGSK
jgi:hypothetical protein